MTGHQLRCTSAADRAPNRFIGRFTRLSITPPGIPARNVFGAALPHKRTKTKSSTIIKQSRNIEIIKISNRGDLNCITKI
jgi:hypothetical protein